MRIFHFTFLALWFLLSVPAFAAHPYDDEREELFRRMQTDQALQEALLSNARVIDAGFDYSRLLAPDTDVLLFGETHGQGNPRREINVILKDLAVRRSSVTHFASEFFLSSEQQDLDDYSQGRITLEELGQRLLFGKELASPAVVAVRYGLKVLGLDLSKAHEDYVWAKSPEGMEARNRHWAPLFSKRLKRQMPGVLWFMGALGILSGRVATFPPFLNC